MPLVDEEGCNEEKTYRDFRRTREISQPASLNRRLVVNGFGNSKASAVLPGIRRWTQVGPACWRDVCQRKILLNITVACTMIFDFRNNRSTREKVRIEKN